MEVATVKCKKVEYKKSRIQKGETEKVEYKKSRIQKGRISKVRIWKNGLGQCPNNDFWSVKKIPFLCIWYSNRKTLLKARMILKTFLEVGICAA